MESEDGLNYYANNVVLRVLGQHDIIKENMYIRLLGINVWTMEYKEENYNPCAWHKVGKEFPGWIGYTYNDYLNFYDTSSEIIHEIVEVIKIK